jgi:hypothetical protein
LIRLRPTDAVLRLNAQSTETAHHPAERLASKANNPAAITREIWQAR